MNKTANPANSDRNEDWSRLLPGFSPSQIDGPYAQRGVLAWDAPITNRPPRQSNWRQLDVAVIGSRRLLDGLRPLCCPIQLSRQNWRLVLDTLRPAVLIIDSFITSADGRWSLDDLSGDDENSIHAIVQGFVAAGLPTVFWNTFDVIYARRFNRLAAASDLSLCSDAGHKTGAYDALLGPACAPSVQSALAPAGRLSASDKALFAASQQSSVALFDGWANLIRNRKDLSFLDAMGVEDLRVVESRFRVWANQKEALGPLKGALLGCVTRPSLWALLRNANVRLAAETNLTPPHEAIWDAIEAASCGTATAFRGSWPAENALNLGNAHTSDSDIVDAVQGLSADPVEAMIQNQQAWRFALEGETYAHRLDVICKMIGLEGGFAHRPLVTALCATFRTEYLENIVANFDAQTYPHKELVMIVNSSTLKEADVIEKIGARDDIRFAIVPVERVEAGSLNHGINMARGEYIVKMDDDDIYGRHYVSDMMHHAQVHNLELFGKTNRFFYFTEQEASYMRVAKSACTMVSPDELMETHIGGATLSGTRDFFSRYPYREGNFAATDTHYYANLENQVAEGKVAVLDDTGFLYRRRNAAEHSWTIDNDALMSGMVKLSDGILKRILD